MKLSEVIVNLQQIQDRLDDDEDPEFYTDYGDELNNLYYDCEYGWIVLDIT